MMTPQRYERVRQLFGATCDLDPRQRARLLERECACDAALRAEVEALLARDADPTLFLGLPHAPRGGSDPSETPMRAAWR